MKYTPFYQEYLENQARIVDFAGWALPLEYTSTLSEAKAVRSRCGLFDASHMGQILIRGAGALSLLQKLTPNDICLIQEGQQQYNLFLNSEGGVVDDLMVYRRQNSFLCVVNALNTDKVYRWLRANAEKNVEIIDVSTNTALLCVQGPCAEDVMQAVMGRDLSDLQYMHFIEGDFDGKKTLISRSGYTGEDGFEIYTAWEDGIKWWCGIMEQRAKYGLQLCGLGARDILRIEVGYPLYGHELDEKINPLEASLEWVVKFEKDFIAKQKILDAKREGVKRKRVGFVMQERAVPRRGYSLYSQGNFIGKVSSGTYSPHLDQFIGMAYIDSQYEQEGTLVDIEIREKFCRARLKSYPFVKLGIKHKGT
ncbi:MAG: glycine cleavage system aminomethyltransferase GcvT [Candidatus Omnitrophota bacterium]|nr:MAG: glycine cleavage system aminomethyltransferase GcvT [Candidatus Omnitrophota bacterium]